MNFSNTIYLSIQIFYSNIYVVGYNGHVHVIGYNGHVHVIGYNVLIHNGK